MSTTDPIQAILGDFDKLVLALSKFRASLSNTAARAAEVTLPPGFSDVTHLVETLDTIDREAAIVEDRLNVTMRQAALVPGRFLTPPSSWHRLQAGVFYVPQRR